MSVQDVLDKLLADALVRELNDATADTCKDAILNNRSLLNETPEGTWDKYRRQVKIIPGLNLNYDSVVDALADNRPDLLAIIASTHGGVQWLEEQVEFARVKLNLNHDKIIYTAD